LQKYAEQLPKAKGKAVQKALFKGGYQAIDDSFLEYIDGIRENIAKAFKKANPELNSEQLTEATQRTVDRLVFIRFLEDKFIEAEEHVSAWQSWNNFITDCRKLDAKYNGVVFKKHFIDEPGFIGADEKLFLDICSEISNLNSPYDFNYIPIHILGSIYERFLGKIVVATDKRVRIEEKPEVRKAGGVYYTPKYIVDYIVKNTVGKIIDGLTPAQIAGKAQRSKTAKVSNKVEKSNAAAPSPWEKAGDEAGALRFADIACGSGSFLIGVYDCLLDYHKKYYTEKLSGKTEIDKRSEDFGNIEYKDGQWVLTLKLKQDILLNNIYGVDIDAQAVEVTQLSLFLKMLEEENVSSTQVKQGALFSKVLPDLSKNIVCGNSLIGWDIMNGQASLAFGEGREGELELKKLNPMDYEAVFPAVMRNGGFDAVVGNPPYLSTKGINEIEKKYFLNSYKTAKGQFDLYGLFIEKCTKILKPYGLFGYITSNTFLSNKDFLALRKELLYKSTIHEIVNFGETVFKDANLDVSILVFENQPLEKENQITIFLTAKDFFDGISHKIEQSYFKSEIDNYEFQINIKSSDAKLLEKLFKYSEQLTSFLDLPRGIELGSNSDKIVNIPTADYRPLLVGKNIKKYEINFDNLFIKFEKEKSVFKEETIYNVPKILIQRIRNLSLKVRIVATLDTEKYLTMNTLRFGLAKFHFVDLKLILGILNSSLVNYIFLKKFFNKDIYAYQLERIPIPFSCNSESFNEENKMRISNLVTQMLEAKKQLAAAVTDSDKSFLQNKCSSIDRQIDKLVYELYGLTEEERKIIETY
jgi:adenine-specific DNA-methyltransferase